MDVNIKNQLVSRTAKVIIFLQENPKSSIKDVSKELDIDYNFTSKIVQRLEEEKLVKTEEISREKQITLTDKGRKISEHAEEIDDLL